MFEQPALLAGVTTSNPGGFFRKTGKRGRDICEICEAIKKRRREHENIDRRAGGRLNLCRIATRRPSARPARIFAESKPRKHIGRVGNINSRPLGVDKTPRAYKPGDRVRFFFTGTNKNSGRTTPAKEERPQDRKPGGTPGARNNESITQCRAR